jgi:hypothetical protein
VRRARDHLNDGPRRPSEDGLTEPAVIALFSAGNLSPGVREDRGNAVTRSCAKPLSDRRGAR